MDSAKMTIFLAGDSTVQSYSRGMAPQCGWVYYVWGHSYEFGQNDSWKIIEDFCKEVGGQEDIWYATNIQIADYMDAVRRLQVGVNSDFACNPSAITVWISVDDDRIVECKPGVITPL
ncbi:hypothetical protein SAMN02745687_01516 [Lachnospiraceae bacterium NK3A20]|nr:hypothetical protein SAMN02745687_01516 [Lachnospiraceae bacterium NK3A20]